MYLNSGIIKRIGLLLGVVFSILSYGQKQTELKDEFGKTEAYYLQKGNEAYGNSEFALARSFYYHAYKINTSNVSTNYFLGICNYQLGYKDKALVFFERTFDLDSTIDIKLYKYLARSCHLVYQFDLAIDYYNQYASKTKDTLEQRKVKKYLEEVNNAKELIKHPKKAKITNLGTKVNSIYDDYSPVISGDGTVLMFTSRRKPDNNAKKSEVDDEYFEEIYVCKKTSDDEWTEPKTLHKVLNSMWHDACIGLSADGNKLFLYKSHKLTNGDIYISELKDTTWTDPEKMPEGINSDFHEPSACLTPDERTIYFSSDRPEGFGGLDIYKSELLPTGVWSEPTNLGSEINTQYDEDSPFIHSDKKTLNFSSNGHNTMGGYDIFITQYDEHYSSWSKPKNIGHPINTPDNDIYFNWTAKDQRAYFSSNRENNVGRHDIYRLDIIEEPKELVIYKGDIKDKTTQKPLDAIVKISSSDVGNNEIIAVFNTRSANDGKFLFVLPFGADYSITVEAKMYLLYSDYLEIPDQRKFLEIERNYQLEPIHEGSKVVLKNIFFDYDKTTLREKSINELHQVILFLEQHDSLTVEIGGHTDSIGSLEYNQKLSLGRSQEVVKYITSKGIDKERLIAKGEAFLKPIASNSSEEGRQLNRRTEFTILNTHYKRIMEAQKTTNK